MTQPEIKTVEDFLDNIENQQLYQVLIKVDRLTLRIAFMKVQGYSTREIASYLRITEKAVYRRLDRLKRKKSKKFLVGKIERSHGLQGERIKLALFFLWRKRIAL